MTVPIDSIVILGGPDLPFRTSAGYRFSLQHPAATLIISGTPAETSLMQQLLTRSYGYTREILVDGNSFSTMDNALHTRAVLLQRHSQSLAIVTSSWHMPRTVAIFRWVFSLSDIHLTFIPAAVGTPRPRIQILEAFKWIVFWLVQRRHSTKY